MQQIFLVDVAIGITTHLISTVTPEDAPTSIATLDGAIEIIPVIEDADVIRGLLEQSSVCLCLAQRLHAKQMVGAIEQTGLGIRTNLSFAMVDADAEAALCKRLHLLINNKYWLLALPSRLKFCLRNLQGLCSCWCIAFEPEFMTVTCSE